jgi:tetratricopeptide (TPR) repeat protein
VRPGTIKTRVFVIACAVVVGVYAFAARSGPLERMSPKPADTYYNLLVRGFQAGRLSLDKAVPPGLAQLPDPYDPAANSPYRAAPHGLHDMSYYRGQLYLYFGVTPALILFWPFAAASGYYLLHRQAAAIFCALGFLLGAAVLRGLHRRYFAEVGAGVLAACALALGLATGLPVLLARSEVYEVAISCGFMLTMAALGAAWLALHSPGRRLLWLSLASAACGLALGARPVLLGAAGLLLASMLWALQAGDAAGARTARSRLGALACATGPIALIGMGLLLYNYARFGRVLEFGQHYQLAGDRQDAGHFSLRYLGFNFRFYFLEPPHFTAHFPFVEPHPAPVVPAGHARIEDPYGILACTPVAWLALAAPLAWRGRRKDARNLRGFVLAAAAVAAASALTLCLFYGSCSRYEVEFAPELILLAAIGIFSVERVLAGQPRRLLAARWGWGLLLALSIAFNLLAGVTHYTEGLIEAHNNLGNALQRIPGRLNDAIAQYEEALRLKPDFAEVHNNLGNALEAEGRLNEAIAQYEEALRLKPDYPEAHNNLGVALGAEGRLNDAIAQYEEALRLKPDDVTIHLSLAVALLKLPGRSDEAKAHLEAVLRLQPGNDAARQILAKVQAAER